MGPARFDNVQRPLDADAEDQLGLLVEVARAVDAGQMVDEAASLDGLLVTLVVSVEAGLGLDQALLKISEKLGRRCMEMSSELHTVHLEVQAGKPRQEALRSFADRTGVPEVEALVGKLIQAEKFGTSIATSLRIHSDTIREKRKQRAEERAGKTVVKMLFPLVFFIFPAMFVVILGPAVMQILDAFT